MKKILAMAAVAALATGASVYAANPFSDVSTSDWAYQAVSDLSDQGIVEGYPDGTFKGETNITRYELAQVIARLMAKEDQYTAEQRATIDKLAAEYADELDSLGVRVSNLEKKVGNISWSGDARMQYQDHGDVDPDTWTGRLRINVSGQVNDQITVEGRLVTEMGFDDASKEDIDDGDTKMDRIHVVYAPSENFNLDLGRTAVGLSQTEIFMDSDGQFGGIIANYEGSSFYASAGYGRFDGVGFDDDADPEVHAYDMSKDEAWFVKAGTNIADTVDLSAFYLKYASKNGMQDFITTYSVDADADDITVWGVGAAIGLGGNFVIDGDYIKHADKTTDDASMWTAGLTYGEVDTEKVGSFSIGLHYADLDDGAALGSVTAWDMSDYFDSLEGVSFWVAKAGVAVAKNVELDAYYYFAADADEGDDPDDIWGVELNYAF